MRACHCRRSFGSSLVLFAIGLALAGGLAVGRSGELSRDGGLRSRVFAVKDVTIVVAPGRTIEKGTIVLRGGLIEAAGENVVVPTDAEVIDGAGLVAYAGFIDALTTAGIDAAVPRSDTGAGRAMNFAESSLAATHPDNRKGLTPEFDVSRAIALADGAIEPWRRGGFTARLVAPTGGIAAGQSSLVALSGQPRREVLLKSPVALHVSFDPPAGGGYPSTILGTIAHLRQAMLDAGHYQRRWVAFERGDAGVARPPVDAALAAFGRALAREEPAWFAANSRDEIHRALDFAEEFKLKPAIVGGREAWRVADRLKQLGAPVVLRMDFDQRGAPSRFRFAGPRPSRAPEGDPAATSGEPKSSEAALAAADVKLHDPELPKRAQEDDDRRLKEVVHNAAELAKAGVPFVFSTEGSENPAKFFENLRKATADGLTPDAALAALTTEPAKLCGVEKRLGTIEPGRLDHVTLWTGKFDDAKSQVRFVFLDGEKFEFKIDAKKPGDSKSGEGKPGDAATLVGTWALTIESADGETAATLELREEAGTVSGTFRSDQGEGKVSAVKRAESDVAFTVEIGAGAKSLKIQFTGKIDGDKLAGTLKSAFGSETKWRAERKGGGPEKPAAAKSDGQKPAEDKKAEAKKPEFATELDADRKPPIQTGGNVLVRNATVLTVAKGTIENGCVLIRDGKITAVGLGLTAPEGVTTIDATGLFVMPGIIDTHSHMAIAGGVNEATQSIVPEVRVRDVVRGDVVEIYRALAGGVTAARLLHGSANTIGGQDAVIKLRWGKPARELVLKDNPQGVKFALGENVTRSSGRFPNSRMGVEATLERAFAEAAAYRAEWDRWEKNRVQKSEVRGQANGIGDGTVSGDVAALSLNAQPSTLNVSPEPRRDLRLEALAKILDGSIRIHSHCYRSDEILMLLRVADRHGVRVQSLQHVLEGYKVAPEIAAHGASCSTFSDWWAYKIEAFDAIPFNAALLGEAGVNVVIKSDSDDLIRHLNHEASKSLRFGDLGEAEALAMVTLNPARELGLDARLGSIEIGKEGDLSIWNGHPLNSFARCEMTLVDGEVYFARTGSLALAKPEGRPKSSPLERPASRKEPLAMPPAGAKRYAIRGAAVFPVASDPIPVGTIIIEGDRIVSVAAGRDVPQDTSIIEADGLSVYPGMIDAGNILGLTEVSSLRETQDFSEIGTFQPDLLAATALHPDSELIPVARAGGVLTVLARPQGGRIGGQSTLANLAGWVPREMTVEPAVALHIQWPAHDSAGAWKRLEDKVKNERRDARRKQIAELAEFIRRAREYHRVRDAVAKESSERAANGAKSAGVADASPSLAPDRRLDAMRPYVRGERPVIVEADTASQILEVLDFAKQHELKLIIEGGNEAWKVADRLKEAGVAVIIGPPTELPREDFDPYDAAYANAARLHAAAVKFCIRTSSATNARNLPFEAAFAVAFGLPADEGLKAVTLYPAEILGAVDRLGSIAPGKLANVVLTDGSPLQPATHIHGVFVAGRPFAPTSKHTELYDRYRRRLGEVKAGTAKLGTEPKSKPTAN